MFSSIFVLLNPTKAEKHNNKKQRKLHLTHAIVILLAGKQVL